MIFAIFGALARAVRRDLGTFGSLAVNNFSLFVALMIYGCAVSGVEPKSSYPLLILLGFLLLFPLSSDPLARIPQARLAFWPLNRRQRWVLRLSSLFLSPVLWLTLFLLGRTAVSLALTFLALAVAAQVAAVSSHGLSSHLRWINKDIRQILTVLDPYLALILCLGGIVYRITAVAADPAAFSVLAILVGLALSTYVQCLFSLDGRAGLTRYRLLPRPGWRILLGKDVAFLAVNLLLVLPLDLVRGSTFAFSVLAIGHWPSVSSRLPLRRWRFAGGRVKWGVAQVVVGTALAAGALEAAPLCLGIAAALYLVSLSVCGAALASRTMDEYRVA